jgi:hypothetical protein
MKVCRKKKYSKKQYSTQDFSQKIVFNIKILFSHSFFFKLPVCTDLLKSNQKKWLYELISLKLNEENEISSFRHGS